MKIFENPAKSMRNFSSFDLAAIGTHGILTLSGLIELAYLLYFIVLVERRVVKDRHNLFSWFNITIVLLSVSLTSLHASTAVCILQRPYLFDATSAVTISELSLCCCELMYVWYTWLRSKSILRMKGGLRCKVAAGVVSAAPGIYSAQFIIMCVHLYWSEKSMKPATMIAFMLASGIGGLAIIAFDCIMLLTFEWFLRENRMDSRTSQTDRSIGTSKRFSVIAGYGRWSCITLLGALFLYIVLAVVGYESTYGNLLQACCYAVLHGAFLLLLAMKVALHSCDSREEQADSLARIGAGTGSLAKIERASVSSHLSENKLVPKSEVISVSIVKKGQLSVGAKEVVTI
ncbi:hypothetical protein HDU78_003891 [Chytriomyces hyalinus]|nr:hypothetical protein HDU78_003891 [Chytriomyces hyalinus]